MKKPCIEIDDLTVAYGDQVIQERLTFTVGVGDIFIVMGGSGCGKSTLLRHLVGLHRPANGTIRYHGVDLWGDDAATRQTLMRRFGVLFQGGALWSSMTLAENIALPLEEHTTLSRLEIGELVELKLALVGLAGFGGYYPSELSGGMRKRAGLARAIALDPEILFLDEPSAGLDPITSRLLDDLILELRANLGATIVVVTHELASLLSIGDDSILLDSGSRTMIASGDPKRLLRESSDPRVIDFLTRGRNGRNGRPEAWTGGGRYPDGVERVGL